MAYRVRRVIERWFSYLDGIFFHEQCRVCSKLLPPAILSAEHSLLPTIEIPKAICLDCWRQTLACNPTIELCPMKHPGSLPIASGRMYTGPIKRLIYKLKYDNDRLLAYDLALLIQKAWSLIAEDFVNEQILLVPVPLHPDRLEERGYNQAEEIAKYLSTRIEVPMEFHALKRIKKTQAQFGLSRVARRQNMSDAFTGIAKYLSGKHIVLVDDVYTSGATLSEAAQAVLYAGALSVSAITVARAVFKAKDIVCNKSWQIVESRSVAVDSMYQNDNIKRGC